MKGEEGKERRGTEKNGKGRADKCERGMREYKWKREEGGRGKE